MRSRQRLVVSALAVASLSAGACLGRGHTSPNCGSSIFSEDVRDAGDLTGATSTASYPCGASINGPYGVDVERFTPGACQVQLVLANGATFTFSVDFAATGTGSCQGAINVVDASAPVLVDPGRCHPSGDAAVAPADAGTTIFGPACAGLTTAIGIPPMRACGCTAADPQVCYLPCGPEGQGARSETCTAGVYAETPNCSFDPARDYSCYQVPLDGYNTSCPATAPGAYLPPQESTACTIDHCVVCNTYGGFGGGEYIDARGQSAIGYCVCGLPDSAGKRAWNCASFEDWPCPYAPGC